MIRTVRAELLILTINTILRVFCCFPIFVTFTFDFVSRKVMCSHYVKCFNFKGPIVGFNLILRMYALMTNLKRDE